MSYYPELSLWDISLTLCVLCNFSCFCCLLLTFFKLNFSKNSFRNTIRVSNVLDPYQDGQDRHNVSQDQGLIYL